MSTNYIGQIQPFAFDFAPYNWALCDGQLLSIAQHPSLFSLLGNIYGGDGKTSFALPDIRGRASSFFGRGPGLSPQEIGEKGGQEKVTLHYIEMPSHKHTVRGVEDIADSAEPTNAYYAVEDSVADRVYHSGGPNTNMAYAMMANSGGNQSHNNMQPYLTINWSICLYGIYPSRS